MPHRPKPPPSECQQTSEQLIEESKRLVEEMRILSAKAEELAKRHHAVLKELAKRK